MRNILNNLLLKVKMYKALSAFNIFKHIATWTCIVSCFLIPLPVHASANTDFDPQYYSDKYPDVVAVYGSATEDLLRHYLEYGIKEGRFPNKSKDTTYSESRPYMTYIDISLHEQRLRYYKDGYLVLDSPCVTGDILKNRDTPTGDFTIQTHTNGKWLNGPTWHVWVDYWMRFTDGNVGIHDASWRKADEFNPETYKGNGSHGCVNLPNDTAKTLFSIVDVGTRVVVH